MATRSKLAGVLAAAVLFAAAAAVAQGARAASESGDAAVRIELGRRLFYDADLSINGTMSCATCHEQRHAFSDNNRTHPGALGHPGKRNVPGLANVGFFRNLTWADNSLGSLERQARNPILGTHPIEMAVAGHEADVIARFASDDCYRRLFAAAFPEAGGRVDLDTITLAIASFERTLVSRDSVYDREVREGAPLSDPAAEAGRKAFLKHGCSDCHPAPYFTDDAFHRVRAVDAGETDAGLADVTGSDDDRGRFRTPPLRNVALTFPYWHNGRARTLEEAIALHDVELTHRATPAPAEVTSVVIFLQTLTDTNFVADERFSLPPATCPTAD